MPLSVLHHVPQVIHCSRAVHGHRRVERYQFWDHWYLHYYMYSFELVLNGKKHAMSSGSLSFVPPGVAMRYHFPRRPCEHFYAILKWRENPVINPDKLVYNPQQVPPDAEATMQAAARAFPTTPAQSTALLWSLLWRLLGDKAPPAFSADPLVNHACELIEWYLNHPLQVSEIAQQLGVSHNHLTRKFRAALGETVISYLTKRRMERARLLLQQTTLPVKKIADECGVPDPHTFNKMVRRHFGCAPRALRGKT